MSESTIHPELISLRAKLTVAIESNQKQADLILKQIAKDRELLHAINGSLGIAIAQATGYGAAMDTIRSAIKLLEKNTFIADDVEQTLRANFPTVPIEKKKLRSALWNMVRMKEIKVVRKGNNRLPAEYERTVVNRFKRVASDLHLNLSTNGNGEKAEEGTRA